MSLVCTDLPCALRRRPLCVVLSALCAASALAAWPQTHADAPRHLAGAEAAETADPSGTVQVTSCADSGGGSLRDAIGAATTGQTIDLTELNCSTISLTTGAILIGQADLTLVGPGANALTIDGADNGQSSVLYHLGAGTLRLESMTVANGNKYSSDIAATGGCVHTEGNIVLYGVAVENCVATGGGIQSALGGGVFARGGADLYFSQISGNQTVSSGYASGGGVYALNGFFSNYSTVSANDARQTAGTPSFGGGVFARGFSAVFNSTISGNSSGRMGGLGLADDYGAGAEIINSTISGNRATVIGGVYVRGPLTLQNSTIAFNDASYYNLNNGPPLGAGLQFNSTTVINSTIIASNTTSIQSDEISAPAGTALSGSNNMTTSASTTVDWPADTIFGDPRLAPLEDNGGFVRTHALDQGSAAINQGSNVGGLSFDERGAGFPRAVGANPDIGAYESNPDLIFANGFN